MQVSLVVVVGLLTEQESDSRDSFERKNPGSGEQMILLLDSLQVKRFLCEKNYEEVMRRQMKETRLTERFIYYVQSFVVQVLCFLSLL